MVTDMTVGKPTKLLLAFSIPMLIGNIFQQFYSMVDTVIVGRFVSVEALAGVGATGGMTFLVLGFVMGIVSGFSVIVAQRFGSNDEEGIRKAVGMSVLLSIVLTIIITILSLVLAKPLLHFMNTPSDIFDYSYSYISIIYAGIIATVFYNLFAAILRALGDSKTPLYFLILASIINVVLDLVFIISFNMGAAGAAVATVISQGISCLLCYYYIKRKFPILKLTKEHFKIDLKLCKKLINISIPMGLQYSVTAIGVMILQGSINGFGSTVVAGYTAASKVEQLVTQPGVTFGTAMATFAAQNPGAGKIDRIHQGIKKCVKLSMIVNILGGIFVIVFGKYIVRVFVSGDQVEVIAASQQYLNTVAIFFCVLGLLFIYRSTLQGIGNSKVPMLSGLTELIMRLGVAIFLSNQIGFTGICLASPIAWIAATILLITSYHKNMRRLDLIGAEAL